MTTSAFQDVENIVQGNPHPTHPNVGLGRLVQLLTELRVRLKGLDNLPQVALVLQGRFHVGGGRSGGLRRLLVILLILCHGQGDNRGGNRNQCQSQQGHVLHHGCECVFLSCTSHLCAMQANNCANIFTKKQISSRIF